MATVEREIRELSGDDIVPGAVPLVTLRLSPAGLTDRIGVDWSVGGDELGEYRCAVFDTGPEQARYVLLSYDLAEPSEITVLGNPESLETLDEVLRTLRVSESEVFDRVDRPSEGPATEAMDSRLLAAVEESLLALRAQVEEIQTEHEISRLASLASIEEADLTPRQREVLQLMVSGLSAEEVADVLALSRATVLRHLRTLRNTLVHRS